MTHLFEERGALDQVAELARDWFTEFLPPARSAIAPQEPARPRLS